MKTQKYKKVASTLSTNNRSVRMRDAAVLNDTTLGVATISIREEVEECPDQIFTPNDITVTKELLRDKSYFFGNEDIKITNNALILPFQDSEFFNYNYYKDGRWSGNLINYGGISLSVWFLPNGTKIDDVQYVGPSDDCRYPKYPKDPKIIPENVIMFSTTAVRIRINQERAGFIDVPIENIGNYTGKNGIRLFVTVIQMYSNPTTPIGSFYID